MVKIGESIVNQLLCLRPVYLLRQTCILRTSAEETLRTHDEPIVVRAAKTVKGVVKWPSAIFIWKLSEPAASVHLATELLDTKYSKEQEDEEHEENCVTKRWQRTEQGRDEPSHFRKRVDAPQGSEDTENTQRPNLAYVFVEEDLNVSSDDDHKVKPVPVVSEVGIPMEYEAHCNYFEDALGCEEVAKNFAQSLKNLVVLALVLKILLVICNQYDWIDNDTENDEVLKERWVSEVHQELTDSALMVEQEQWLCIIYHNFVGIHAFIGGFASDSVKERPVLNFEYAFNIVRAFIFGILSSIFFD